MIVAFGSVVFATWSGIRRVVLASATAAATVVCLGLGGPATAQSPVALPNTITTIAGGATGAGGSVTGGVLPAKGAACSAGSPYVATDAYGDGCPGLNTAFSSDFRGGLQVDGLGNVFILDTTNALVRRIDARSGLVTAVTGTSITGCTANTDAYGDGCPFAQTKLSTARGVWVDPYGNVLIAGYGMQTINILCNAVSPLCPNTAGHKQVGSLYRVAGCVSSATATGSTGTGITNGTSGDGYAASPYGNLAGDVADWNPGNVTNLGVTGFGSCTAAATLGAVSSPRGVAADRYGNVYIAETGTSGAGYRYRVVVGPASFTLPSGTVLTNPLASIIALDPAYASVTPASAYGKIYPIVGGFTAAATGTTPPATLGAACAGTAGGSTLDTLGDGCPFYESTSGTGQQGVGVDASGNVIFSDNSKSIVRVLFTEPSVAGGATSTSRMANEIRAANGNPALAITQGYLYPIAGALNPGATSPAPGPTPTLATATTLSTGLTKVAVDASGNIYLSDFSNSSVLFFDAATGYIRRLFITGSACAAKLDSLGDGCPANASNFGSGASGMGIGISPEGDLYLADNTNLLIRKITATNLVPVPKGASVTQSEIFHAPAGTTALTALLVNPSSEISLGAASCAAANPDSTVDCTVPVTFSPGAPGLRADSLSATLTGSTGSAVFPVAGIATAAALVSDSASPTTTTVGAVTSASALAIDGQDDVLVADPGAGHFEKISTSGTTTTLGGTLPASPYQLTVDPQGNIFASGAGAANLTRLTPGTAGAYASSTFSFVPTQANSSAAASTPAIYGVVADRQGNLFVADRTNEAVYEIPAANLQTGTALSSNLNPVVTVKSGFNQLGELALDGSGNLFIADVGASTVYRLLAGASATSTFAANVNPTHIAADAGGDLYVEDATAKTVTEYTTSGLGTVPVYTATAAPTGLAIASSGAAYVALNGASTLTEVERNQATHNFGATSGPGNAFAGELTNSGNSAATGTTITAATGAKFIFDTTNTSTCGVLPSAANALLSGASCSFNAYFNPATSGTSVSATVNLLPASAVGTLTLSGTEPFGTTFPTITSVSGPATVSYLASGVDATYTVRVSATGTADVPTGSVTATSDCAVGSGLYPLAGGTVTISVSGCMAGTHTLTVSYPNTGDASTPNSAFGNSLGSAATVVAQAPTALSWTPTATSRPYSAALGLGVLNATATSGGSAVPGTVVYSASAGGTSSFVHSASFLPIGTYTLTATFYPADAVDFASSTMTFPNFTVTKASTNATVGATQMLVAADGTGNFSSVQAALNTLPPSGGSVYIKPGTYTGNVTVVQPGVSLRGLGGNPQSVVLTHSGGAFGSTGVYAYAGEFTSAQNNGAQLPSGSSLFSGDEGSATLVVAPGINAAVSSSTLTPNGFYAENLTLANSYDSDTVTTTTTYVAGGNCSANAGPAQTYSYLFNNSLLCASQALAIWNTADLSVFNNVYTTSLQDTIYAGSQGAGSNGYVPSRQYWFRGKVVGTVDYIFGDAAAVFDYSSIYTVPHGTGLTGTETIEAQNKARQTGATGDYLSGYVMNSNVFTSYAPGMTGLEFGRPYGAYSTWIMLNSYVDQVAPAGYIEFSGDSNLPTSTYDEFNDLLYTDPAPNTPDLNGVLYAGLGGNTGSGVTGTRETTSASPGTPMANNAVRTSMSQVQAQAYFPTNFLSTPVPSSISSTPSWVPTDAIAADANAFVPAAASATVAPGSSVTILMRPQTPGLGAVANGNYTVPSGTYVLTDNFGGASTTLASGSLDASGEAYYTSSALPPGTHLLSWTYSGDSNFSASNTASAYPLIVTGYPTATALAGPTTTVAFGQASTFVATISSATPGTPTGNVTLTVDSATSQTIALSGTTATFTVSGLLPGTHSVTATYAGVTPYAASTSAAVSLVVSQASPAITVNTASLAYGSRSTTLSATVSYAGAQAPTGGLTFTVNGSTSGVGAATCFGSSSPLTCTATYSNTLGAGSYAISATEASDTNYAAAAGSGSLIVTQPGPSVLVAPVSAAYGAASATLTAALAYPGAAAPTGAVSFTVNGSAAGVGAASCSGTSSPLTCTARLSAPTLPGGSYAIKVAEAADSNYIASSGSGTLTVTPIAPAVTVGSSAVIFGSTAANLTATVAYTGAAAPAGALLFSVNGSATGVGTVTCSGTASPLTCKATYTPGSLAAGSYAVSATQAADPNYTAAAATGTLLITSAADFSFTNSGTAYQTVAPGASTTYTFALSPLFASYPGAVSFTVSGLPAGATYTLTPSSVASTGGAQSVVFTVVTPAAVAAGAAHRFPWSRGLEFALAACLLPLCLRRQRGGLRPRLLLLLASVGSLLVLGAIAGCGAGGGNFNQASTNYTLAVTATSGTVQHTSSVTLNLQ